MVGVLQSLVFDYDYESVTTLEGDPDYVENVTAKTLQDAMDIVSIENKGEIYDLDDADVESLGIEAVVCTHVRFHFVKYVSRNKQIN